MAGVGYHAGGNEPWMNALSKSAGRSRVSAAMRAMASDTVAQARACSSVGRSSSRRPSSVNVSLLRVAEAG